MNDRYIDKSLLYLVLISLSLHAAVAALLYYTPLFSSEPPKEPVFIDLQQVSPVMPQPEPRQTETRRRSDQRTRVPKEAAPRGDARRDSSTSGQVTAAIRKQPPPAAVTPKTAVPEERRQPDSTPGSPASSLLKPKALPVPQPPQPQLFPGASRLAKLEESYRRKFEQDIAEGDTRFLNSDDILFGSFLRRFEGAVYGVWRYPQEAALKGIEGITPVRITFNRRGEITNIIQLESSGARILDDEVVRTLRAIGPIGGFPKGYDREEFHLIAFFQYGGTRRSLR